MAPPLRLAVLAIGDAVLQFGTFQDANAAHVHTAFADAGVDHELVEVRYVRDDADDIADAARSLAQQCDLVITTGGAGYTTNDGARYGLGRLTGGAMQVDRARLVRTMTAFESTPLADRLDPDVPARLATFPRGTLHLDRGDVVALPIVRAEGLAPIAMCSGLPVIFDAEMRHLAYVLERFDIDHLMHEPTGDVIDITDEFLDGYTPETRAAQRGVTLQGVGVVIVGDHAVRTGYRADLQAIARAHIEHGASIVEARVVDPDSSLDRHIDALQARPDITRVLVMDHSGRVQSPHIGVRADGTIDAAELAARIPTDGVASYVGATTLAESDLHEALAELHDHHAAAGLAVRIQPFMNPLSGGETVDVAITARSQPDVRRVLEDLRTRGVHVSPAARPEPPAAFDVRAHRDGAYMYPFKANEGMGQRARALLIALDEFDGAHTPLREISPSDGRDLTELVDAATHAYRATLTEVAQSTALLHDDRWMKQAWDENYWHGDAVGPLKLHHELTAGMLARRIGFNKAARQLLAGVRGRGLDRHQPIVEYIATVELAATHSQLATAAVTDPHLALTFDADFETRAALGLVEHAMNHPSHRRIRAALRGEPVVAPEGVLAELELARRVGATTGVATSLPISHVRYEAHDVPPFRGATIQAVMGGTVDATRAMIAAEHAGDPVLAARIGTVASARTTPRIGDARGGIGG